MKNTLYQQGLYTLYPLQRDSYTSLLWASFIYCLVVIVESRKTSGIMRGPETTKAIVIHSHISMLLPLPFSNPNDYIGREVALYCYPTTYTTDLSFCIKPLSVESFKDHFFQC